MPASKKARFSIEDRDENSRIVAIKDSKLDIAPDVDVNTRTEIMGDEGPVAEHNPHNMAEPVVAPKSRRGGKAA